MNTNNFIKIKRRSLGYYYYCFVDTEQHLADQLFIKHKVTVKFCGEFAKDTTVYRMILCRIHKSDEAEFLKALDELNDKMSLFEYRSYQEFCKNIFGEIEHEIGI